jgi:hypothetical protein
VKKRYILMAALIAIAFCTGVASCKSAPKAPEELPEVLIAPEPEPEFEPEFEMEDTLAEADEEFEDEEAFELEDSEDDFLAFDEPEEVFEEVFDVAVVPEPELELEPEPESEPAVSPPIVTAVSPPVAPAPEPPQAPPPVVAPAPPRPVTPPPSPRPSTPSPAPLVTPPPAVAPPPPVIAEEKPPELPPLYDGPELPYPSTGIRDRPDDTMLFSRSVRATAGQLIEVPFRGTGWVYLGENGAQRGIVYDSRRLDPEGQSFIFRTQLPGEYALKFYRQDFIRDFILNDYVRVVVDAVPEATGTGWFNPPIDRNRVVAEPRWPSPLTEAQSLRPQPPAAAAAAATAPVRTPAPPSATPSAPPPASPRRESSVPESVATAPPQTAAPSPTPANGGTDQPVPPQDSAVPDIPLNIDPETYLEKAKEEFNAGRIAAAIAFLDRFRGHYPLETDELLWLYGQFYEANSPSRDILASLGYYRRLVDEYPQSNRYDDARRRIAYLQRYYININ